MCLFIFCFFILITAESDICTFAARTEHFHVTNKPSTALFTSNTRPRALKELYEAAGVVAVRSLDSLRRDGSSMDMFLCTPVLGKRRRDQSLDIESRVVSNIPLLVFALKTKYESVSFTHSLTLFLFLSFCFRPFTFAVSPYIAESNNTPQLFNLSFAVQITSYNHRAYVPYVPIRVCKVFLSFYFFFPLLF